MARNSYSAEFKAKIVLKVLQEEQELGEIAAVNGINPNMVRNWKKEFVANASRVFDESRQGKEAQRKEEELKKKQEQMLKTIGQLTLERDFLQECFRKSGQRVPQLHQE